MQQARRTQVRRTATAHQIITVKAVLIPPMVNRLLVSGAVLLLLAEPVGFVFSSSTHHLNLYRKIYNKKGMVEKSGAATT
ncbi:hypothetical protein TB2_021964 [Malus domestica]